MNINELRNFVRKTLKEHRAMPAIERNRQKKLLETLQQSKLILEKEEEKKEKKESSSQQGADPDKLDHKKFPLKLSDVAKDSSLAEKLVTSGDGAADAIGVGEWKGSANQLSPSQTSMNLGKAAWFALGMLNGTMYGSGGPGGDTGALISSDNYLMDGHHRWIATAMADPSAEIKGFAVSFPGKELVAVLNTVTVGMFGIEKGKPGSGGFEQFQDLEAIKTTLQNLANDSMDNGKGGTFSGVAGATEKGKAKEVIESQTKLEGQEAIDALAQQMHDNLSKVPGAKGAASVMPGAPDRVDMPVIGDDDLAKKNKPSLKNAVQALQQGKIDVNENVGRWAELAGILKD